jgi:O-antigen ligase
MSAYRNFGFIRFGILFLAFNYFFYNKDFINRVLIVWILTLSILTLDTYLESIFGRNILGYGEEYGRRIVSFFKDEPIVGGYINGFYLVLIGYLFYLNDKIVNKYKNIILIYSIFFLIAIVLTGERSNSIKAVFGFFLFYSFNDFFKFKEKILSILLLILMFTLLLNTSDFLKLRYGGQFFKPIISIFQSNGQIQKNEISIKNKLKDNIYISLYQSGFDVFKKYPIFGVGNKNYRLETCSAKNITKYNCSTHPHQIYFEFLAEHGLIGSMILLFILFNLVFSKIKIILNSKNYLQLGCLIFLIISFVPFLPSGAFFADYSLTIFWVNLSIMYAVEKKTNVYN